jgi:pimeloyl-ACP methyl ester carboxylesterase
LTYLLIHGGGSTARIWDRLQPRLDDRALAVDLPGRAGKPADLATLTVHEEASSVLVDVEAAGIEDRIIVVAHSSGGLVVPEVVAGLGGRVAGIVLSAALVPTEGGCGVDCMQPRHRDGLVLAMEQARRDGTVITLPGPPADPEPMRTAYGGDPLDDDTLAFVTDPNRYVTDTVNHYFQPVHWSQVGEVPVTYLLNERDRPIPADLQREMVGRLPRPAEVVTLPGGHLPAVTEPEDFARRLGSLSS